MKKTAVVTSLVLAAFGAGAAYLASREDSRAWFVKTGTAAYKGFTGAVEWVNQFREKDSYDFSQHELPKYEANGSYHREPEYTHN